MSGAEIAIEARPARSQMAAALASHWPEYAMEGLGLGLFMISASLFASILEFPGSPVRAAIPGAATRRLLMGVAMGLTAIGNVYSPWGRRSGAHLNPSVTLTFLRLGKIERPDALFYVLFQFAGGLLGMAAAAWLVGSPLKDAHVNYVATVPGARGRTAAFAAEILISFLMMGAVLIVSNTRSLARYTGIAAGTVVAAWITLEAPISGMSMNPARTTASAAAAGVWTALWIYFAAPPLGMLLASEAFVRAWGTRAVLCAKLHHDHRVRCIFRCGAHADPSGPPAAR